MSKIDIFPKEPPRPASKPIREPGKTPAPLPKDSLWFVHDPAIYQ